MEKIELVQAFRMARSGEKRKQNLVTCLNDFKKMKNDEK